VLQHIYLCCSVITYVAAYLYVLQCKYMCCSGFTFVALYSHVLQQIYMCCTVVITCVAAYRYLSILTVKGIANLMISCNRQMQQHSSLLQLVAARVLLHMWISRVTHVNESCHMCEWVTLQVKCEGVLSHVWMRHVNNVVAESCHTRGWVIPHMQMSHITRNIWMCVCILVMYVF